MSVVSGTMGNLRGRSRSKRRESTERETRRKGMGRDKSEGKGKLLGSFSLLNKHSGAGSNLSR